MKIRYDFVTNSSSSSFVIAKKHLDEDQLEAIRENGLMGRRLGICSSYGDYWDIEENDKYISGSVIMDNYDISELFNIIGVSDSIVKWNASLPDYVMDDIIGALGEDDDMNWREILREIRGCAYEV